jgi:hypothetical protein
VDELAECAESVGGRDPRQWTVVDSPDIAAEWSRIMTERIPEPPRPELIAVERAPKAVRVRYSGGMNSALGSDYDQEAWLREFVRDVANSVADDYLAPPPF